MTSVVINMWQEGMFRLGRGVLFPKTIRSVEDEDIRGWLLFRECPPFLLSKTSVGSDLWDEVRGIIDGNGSWFSMWGDVP